MNDYSKQFDDHLEGIKENYVRVFELFERMDNHITEFIKDNPELDGNLKWCLIGRALNVLHTRYTVIEYKSEEV